MGVIHSRVAHKVRPKIFLSKYSFLDHAYYTLMKSDGLTPYPVFPQSFHPLLWPSTKEQECVCLFDIMPCPVHIAKFSLCKSHHPWSQTLYCGLKLSLL